jgi:hypothetical protein
LKGIVALAIVSFLLVTHLARAQDKDKCVYTLKCVGEAKSFSLEFKSPTKDCTNDDMEIFYKTKTLTRKLDLKKAWYYFTGHIMKAQNSICRSDDKQAAPSAIYDAGKERAIAFLRTSGRPGFDRVHYVLLNTKVGAVIETGDLGSTKNSFVPVLKSPTGYKLRIIRNSLSFSDQVACACDAGFIDDWMQVTVKDDKVSFDWMEKPEKLEVKADSKPSTKPDIKAAVKN